jgi:hypothetical protein
VLQGILPTLVPNRNRVRGERSRWPRRNVEDDGGRSFVKQLPDEFHESERILKACTRIEASDAEGDPHPRLLALPAEARSRRVVSELPQRTDLGGPPPASKTQRDPRLVAPLQTERGVPHRRQHDACHTACTQVLRRTPPMVIFLAEDSLSASATRSSYSLAESCTDSPAARTTREARSMRGRGRPGAGAQAGRTARMHTKGSCWTNGFRACRGLRRARARNRSGWGKRDNGDGEDAEVTKDHLRHTGSCARLLLPLRLADLLEVPELRDRVLVALLGGLPRLPVERATLVFPVVLLLVGLAGS